jgi:hypothetical protein
MSTPIAKVTMQDSSSETSPTSQVRAPDSVRVQILATEHWSLLASRNLIWNETFSRAAMFLTSLSAAVVSLALIAQVAHYGNDFRIFALLVLPVVLLLGVGTFIRMIDAWSEDVWFVLGMNRIRHAYLDIAPELEQYFITSHYDDPAGMMQSFSPGGHHRPSRILVSTPVLIGVINAVLTGVIVSVIAEVIGASTITYISIGVCVSVAVAGWIVWIMVHRDIGRPNKGYVPRFPRPGASHPPGPR